MNVALELNPDWHSTVSSLSKDRSHLSIKETELVTGIPHAGTPATQRIRISSSSSETDAETTDDDRPKVIDNRPNRTSYLTIVLVLAILLVIALILQILIITKRKSLGTSEALRTGVSTDEIDFFTSQLPSSEPTISPYPTISPSTVPSQSQIPTNTPSSSPTSLPTSSPTDKPSTTPSTSPTSSPTSQPSKSPTDAPTT
eukprot:CAMPEP_0172507202 /NCGR_PEP_ID=MMETSP1066-20121228/202168_1 /TAXON_ID=671091 /ORGANISM="Coscinodiscus wailesii, Strain CCMP2513" /LENGTH=199 /DNA_ID=CAMNT_0013284661 /DNA_START=51 /DNA_END=646 /DNA_ORIENTATION=-